MKAWPHPPKTVAATVLVLISVTGCSAGPPVLPDRAAPAVKAEEARLATLLGADSSILGVPGVCTVRLLGQQAGAPFVWAQCVAPGPIGTAASLPLRVDGAKVTMAADGAAYSETVREMFPENLADFVLNNQDSPELRPSAVPPSFPGG